MISGNTRESLDWVLRKVYLRKGLESVRTGCQGSTEVTTPGVFKRHIDEVLKGVT